jgi:cytochrome c
MYGFSITLGMIALLGVGFFRGCQTPQKMQPVATTVSPIDQQIARGGAVYARHCAACHGSSGEGSQQGPVLVGSGALPRKPRSDSSRQAEFRTALDVAQFVTQSMPPDKARRQSIAEEDYWALLAFALSANGVSLTEPVTPHNAQRLVLHP